MSEALERTKRSLDLIPYILEHQGITLDELAHKFNISTEILYEDLNLLFCCGLPGYTPLELIDLSFDDGYVSVLEPQELDVPRKLSKQELLRLHLGLEVCGKYAPNHLQPRIKKLQDQISKLMTSSAPIEIVMEESEAKLKVILEAITSNSALKFKYVSAKSDSLSERIISPNAVSESLNHICVEGIEIISGLEKSFRLDRMSDISLAALDISKLVKHQSTLQGSPVKLHIDASAHNFLNANASIILESHNLESGYEVSLSTVSESWLISEIFAYGGRIRVIEPKALGKRIAEIAKSRLGNL